MKKNTKYNQIALILTTIGIAFLWLISTWSMENEIDNLKLDIQQQTDSLNSTIDSLKGEIDTLIWDNEIWDYNKYESIDTTIVNWPWGREEIYYFKYKHVSKETPDWTGTTQGELISAIIHVESRGNDSAYCKPEDAVGCLQIRRCMINDVNRILKRQKSTKRYTYEDRWSRVKSIEIYNIICNHYGWDTSEKIARCWNGGPRGINNPATVGYWNKVKNEINS